MKIKKYKAGGKTPLTAKQKADIEAEKKRLAAAKRKIARAKNNQSAVEARKTIAGVNDSLTNNASPMQKELNTVENVADGMEAANIVSFANKLQHGNKDAIYFTKKVNGKTYLKGAEDFISDSEQDAEGRYRKGLKKNLANSINLGIQKSIYENIIWMDADFQHPPDFLKLFHDQQKKYDVVIFSRFLTNSVRYFEKEKFKKEYNENQSVFFNRLCNFLLHDDLTDYTSGFICIKKKIYFQHEVLLQQYRFHQCQRQLLQILN